MVSYWVARTGKPCTIVEDCCYGYGWGNAGGKDKNTVQTMTSSNNTVSLNPLPFMVVRSGVRSKIKNSQDGTNPKMGQKYSLCTNVIHQIMHAEQN
jgi:hypothetical protein